MSPIISSLSTVRSSYGFGRKIIIPEIGGGGGVTDPDFSSVSLLMYGDGANGSTTFTDSSSNNFTITPAGNAQISTTQSKFDGASMYFDGSGDYLTVPTDNAFTLDADFTIEWWSWKSTNGYYDGVIGASSGGSNFIELSSSRSYFAIYFSNGGGVVYSPYNPNDSTWHHYAITRSGTTVRLYIDGTQVASGTQSASFSFTFIGQYANSAWFNGYIDDLRITKGVARYTANFTPPTASFSTLTPGEPYFYNTSLLLHGDGTNGSTTFVDSSSNNFTITPSGNAQISTTQSKFGGASMYFDSIEDRLTLPSDARFAFGTGDFTIEMWKYSEDISGATQRGLLQISSTAGGLSTDLFSGVVIGYGSGGILNVNAENVQVNCSISLSQNTWYHVAFTRSGNVHRLFIDGIQRGSVTSTAGNITAQNLVIGGYYSTSFLYKGYIDDLRITKGVARYTANFTPPTAAFPNA